MTRPALALLALSAFAAFSCGDRIDRDIEHRLTISQGVYGQVTTGCDTVGCEEDYLEGAKVALFDRPLSLGDDVPPAIATNLSEGQGFYEIEVDAGTYFIGVDAVDEDEGFTPGTTMEEIDVGDGLLRMDWQSGLDGGTWTER